jgi:L-lactate dehydrogenase
VDRTGVREVLPLTISNEEKALLHKSAEKLKGLIESIS